MATLRDLRRRIASIRGTQQITKAMRMVAAAKLRRAQERLLRARPYAYRLNQVIGHVAARVDRNRHPLLAERPPKKVCYLVITADRGLCGSFNTNIVRRARTEISLHRDPPASMMVVGKKGRDHFVRRGYPVLAEFVNLFQDLQFGHATAIASRIIHLYTSQDLDRVFVVYNEFKSPVQQRIVVEQLLPIIPLLPEKEKHPVDYLYEPSPDAILEALCPKHLNIQVWRLLLESFAAEQGARMVAMENATDNAEEMIFELTLYYNKVRQATITKEIAEIVGGAEALKR